jgi:energy-converting hydrogenase Eha subunit E
LKREILGGVWLVVGMVPLYVLASLTSMYFFRKYQLVAVSDKEIEAVIVSAVGVTIVFLCYLICLDLFRSVTAWHVKRMIKKRNLIGADRSNRA